MTPIQLLVSIVLSLMSTTIFSAATVEAQIQQYQQSGATEANAENGERLWYSSQNQRSCTSCHADHPRSPGRHIKTRKPIEAMAVSVNPTRYQDRKKVEKWFLRNCKWTFGRVCSTQEKADFLAWLSSQ